MIQSFAAFNYNDEQGNPAGGNVAARGLSIRWQNGPLRPYPGAAPEEPNGAFVETVLAAALQRIQYYQEGKFACRQNALAITKIEEALHWLQDRTNDRVQRGVEGTHNP